MEAATVPNRAFKTMSSRAVSHTLLSVRGSARDFPCRIAIYLSQCAPRRQCRRKSLGNSSSSSLRSVSILLEKSLRSRVTSLETPCSPNTRSTRNHFGRLRAGRRYIGIAAPSITLQGVVLANDLRAYWIEVRIIAHPVQIAVLRLIKNNGLVRPEKRCPRSLCRASNLALYVPKSHCMPRTSVDCGVSIIR